MFRQTLLYLFALLDQSSKFIINLVIDAIGVVVVRKAAFLDFLDVLFDAADIH